jgi:hypothetical protein
MFAKTAVTIVASVALLSGCGLSAASQPPAGCPAGGWDAALVWSSTSEPAGEITFLKGDQVVGRQSMPYQGLDPAPSDGAFRVGDAVWLKANGDVGRDKTHLLRYDTRTCSTRAYRVDEQVVRAVAADETGFVTTNTINGAAHVIRRDLEGKTVASVELADLTLTALLPVEGRLYALGATMGSDADVAVLLDLDPTTLAETRRATLVGVVGSDDLVVRGDKIYYPKTVVRAVTGSEAEGFAMGVVNLTDFTLSEIDLAVPAPDVVAAEGGALYTAHTFMNPGFRDTDAYRTVTRLDPDSGVVTSVEVGPGLLSIATRTDQLVAVNQAAGGEPTVTTYRLPDLAKVSSVSVPHPEGDHFYVASILTAPQ